MRSAKLPPKNNAARAKNNRGKKNGLPDKKDESGEENVPVNKKAATPLNALHSKIQKKINSESENFEEVNPEKEIQTKKNEKVAASSAPSINPSFKYITSCDGVRLASHPDRWNKPGEYSLLPEGAALKIVSLGKNEFFNTESIHQWVEVELLTVPMGKHPGGMKAVFARRKGWVMSSYLKLPEIIPQEKKLKAAPTALSGLFYYFQIRQRNIRLDYDYELWDYSLKAGKYDVIPLVKEIKGVPYVVAYEVMDYRENKPVYMIGPDKMEDFLRDPEHPFEKFQDEETAESIDKKRFPAASNAVSGVYTYNSARAAEFPKYQGSVGGYDFTIKAPPYELKAWVKKENGTNKVVAYAAVDYNTGTSEWIVGPDALDEFMANTSHYVSMREENKSEFVSFEQEEKEKQEAWAWAAFVAEEKRKQKESDDKHWMSQSQQAVASAFRGNWSEAWSHVGESWVGERGALRSPDWYVYFGTSLVGSMGGGRNKAGNTPKMNKVYNATKKNKYANFASPQRTKHILAGDITGGGHAWFGSLKSFINGLRGKKNMFPINWNNKKIMHAISYVATNNKWIQQTGKIGAKYTSSGKPVRYSIEGLYEGVKIKVIATENEIITAFPIK